MACLVSIVSLQTCRFLVYEDRRYVFSLFILDILDGTKNRVKCKFMCSTATALLPLWLLSDSYVYMEMT